MPIGDDRAPVQTQAESHKNGRIARREAPDKSALYYIYGKNMHLLISTGEEIGVNALARRWATWSVTHTYSSANAWRRGGLAVSPRR